MIVSLLRSSFSAGLLLDCFVESFEVFNNFPSSDTLPMVANTLPAVSTVSDFTTFRLFNCFSIHVTVPVFRVWHQKLRGPGHVQDVNKSHHVRCSDNLRQVQPTVVDFAQGASSPTNLPAAFASSFTTCENKNA